MKPTMAADIRKAATFGFLFFVTLLIRVTSPAGPKYPSL
jgi:hypothetical protein